jgi:hypothetical protein
VSGGGSRIPPQRRGCDHDPEGSGEGSQDRGLATVLVDPHSLSAALAEVTVGPTVEFQGRLYRETINGFLLRCD